MITQQVAHKALLGLFLCLTLSFTAESKNRPVNLRCEYLSTPVGIDTQSPRFMWQLESDKNASGQSAYQLQIATSEKLLEEGKADIWNSGKVISDKNTAEYTGNKPLSSNQKYWWRVELWDKSGKKRKSSAASWFVTGFMSQKEWTAKWITDAHNKDYKPSPLFRKGFNLKKDIESAYINISGLGYYELFMNGEKVGDHLLDPGYTDYSKRVLYVNYDVTNQLTKGDNMIGISLGNGWYNEQTPAVWNFHLAPWRNRPRLICQLNITYKDGSVETINSDDSWKTSTGPLLYDNLYTGVIYDARLEQTGWNTTQFNDSSWNNVTLTSSPAPIIESQLMPAVGIGDIISPVSIKKFNDQLYVYDLGKNFAGVPLLTVEGKKGTKITLRHGELIYPDGRVDQRNVSMHLRPTDPTEQIQTDVYILKGEGTEEFMPPFVYHGFQYIEVETSEPLEFSLENIKGVVMHSKVEPIGHFSCSNELINKIWDAANRSYLSNLFGIPTDCPHREKNGWTADGHIVMESGLLNFDGGTIYAKWVNDMVDAQAKDGSIPGIVPTSWHWDSNWAGPIWDAAIFIVPYTLYQYTGDIKPIEKIYDTGKKYLDFLKTKEVEGLLDHGLGDWLTYQAQTSVGLLTSCYYYKDYILMAKMAHLLDKPNDADLYTVKANQIKELINKKYLNTENVSYGEDTQLSYAAPLYMGIVPDNLKEKMAENLNRTIAGNDYSLDFGFVGSKIIPIILSNYGYDETMYKIITKETMPSWGYWIEKFNATSLYETWDHTRNIGDASLNHPSMGSINAWMYKSLAGINMDPQNPNFRHVEIKPSFIRDLDWVRAEYKSSQGLISSSWKRKNGKIVLDIVIPANTSATIYTGATSSEISDKGISQLKDSNNHVYYKVKSGSYRVVIPNKKAVTNNVTAFVGK